MWHELRQSARTLRRDSGFTLFAVGLLALGIGANSTMFSVVDSVMLRPLPYPEAKRLVMLHELRPKVGETAVSSKDFHDWQTMTTQTFDGLAAFSHDTGNIVKSEGTARSVRSLIASKEFFAMFGARMQQGRMFTQAEELNGKSGSVALVSERYWRNEMGGNPAVIGKSFTAYDQQMQIVGVVADGFQTPWDADVYLCFDLLRDVGTRETAMLDVVGRLRPDVALAAAKAEMDTVAAQLATAYPATNREARATVRPLQEELLRGHGGQLLTLLAATGLVLLLGCVNLAHLALARATTRQRELAIRMALGAGRGDLARHILGKLYCWSCWAAEWDWWEPG